MACQDCIHIVCLGMDCKLAQEDIERVYAKFPVLKPYSQINCENSTNQSEVARA